ncbi:MAG: phosphoenolpyruvate synthase [Sandaracinaceae bacterium]|nr:MAG: phosphoenolpyruvate synthase [Sandaracinaceae bacterium]
MSALVRRIESIVPRKADAFGGKAKNLAALARAGFPVPAAYALEARAAADFFAGALAETDQPGTLLTAPQRALTDGRLEDLRGQALAAPLPDATKAALREALSALRAEGAVAVAVRSSSTREDQEASSAAGLHETVLGVRTEEELFAAVRACWSSVLTRSAISYLRTLPLDEAREAGIGIVVQAMVPAEVAGALFTVNPLSGDPGEMVINASYGLGNLVMDGRVSPDTYRVDKATGWVRDRVVGEKALASRWLPDGVAEEEVPEAQRELECLGEDLLAALVDLGRRVEGHFDDARDIEWAAVGGTVFLLQARPVTALSRPPRRASKRRAGRERGRIVWSNVNVGEALPGVATPMTWSVLSDFSERGFRRAFGALGCRVPRDAELVGSFRGRIYLNLTEFMEIASQVPGLRPKTLLALGGGGEEAHLEMQVESQGSTGFVLRLPLTVARYLRQNAGLTERVKRFDKGFAEERGRLLAIDFRVLSSSGLDRVLHRVERLLDESGLVMLNVYGNLLATVLLMRAVLQVIFKDQAERVERELLTGLSDVESAAPGLTLWHIAETAQADAAAREVLLAHEASALRVALLPEGPTRRALDRFFTAYGYRGAREAEIAEARWAEDPTLPFATLRAHLMRQNGASPLDVERRQRAVRDRAAAELERRMPGPAKVAMRHLLALVQRFTRLRERLRSHVVQVLGLYRAVGLDASRRMMVREPGIGPGAAFYLSVEELHAFLRGDVERVEPLISRRRLQLERDRALPDPPDTFVGFPPAPTAEGAPSDALTGLAACSGVAVGKARVLMSPADADTLEAGEILVAPYADVGWSPLFLVAGAVVTDLGGPLSHAAVVAREYGVPTVVNVKGGTRSIQTGDEVEVDGGAGTVRVLSRAR